MVRLGRSDHTLPPEILVSSFSFKFWTSFCSSMPSLVHDTFGVFAPKIFHHIGVVWPHFAPRNFGKFFSLLNFYYQIMTAHQNLGMILLVSKCVIINGFRTATLGESTAYERLMHDFRKINFLVSNVHYALWLQFDKLGVFFWSEAPVLLL